MLLTPSGESTFQQQIISLQCWETRELATPFLPSTPPLLLYPSAANGLSLCCVILRLHQRTSLSPLSSVSRPSLTMDGDESHTNSLRDATTSVGETRASQSPSNNSITSKVGDQFLPDSMHKMAASCRTRRENTATDLSAFMNTQFFFRENSGDIVPGSNTLNSEEANRRGRMLEWLLDVEMQMSSCDSSIEWSSNRPPPPSRDIANAAPKLLPRPRTPGSSSSGPLDSRSSGAKSLLSDQFPHHRQSPSAVCKLPCQSCGNAHELMPQNHRLSPSPESHRETRPAPQGLYKRNDRLSKSDRHPEMAVDVPPSLVRTKKTPSRAVPPPVVMYPKFDRFSKSARHPEMAANVVLAGEPDNDQSKKVFVNSNERSNPDLGRHVRHMRSASVGIPTSDNTDPRVEHNGWLSFESNRNRKENMPRMLHSSSAREQRGSIKSKHGSTTGFPSPSYNDSQSKSTAAAVHQWFSQLLRKGPKTGPKVAPVKAGKPPLQPKRKDASSTRKQSRNHGDRFAGVSYNSSNMELEPEQLVIGATLSDVLNTKGVIITETKVLLNSSAKVDQRPSVSNDKTQVVDSTPRLRRSSSSVHSDRLFHSSPVQERASLTLPWRSSLDSMTVNQQTKGNGLLSPPKRRKEAASRLEMLVKDNERYNSTSSSANSSPQKSRQEESEAHLIGEKLEEVVKLKRYEVEELNEFLRRQRRSVNQNSSDLKIMVILSEQGFSSLSSMVSTICYAWILENTTSRSPSGWIHVPVINTPRRNMWKNEQAAWLFHQSGLDTKALLFSDEVDIENLAHTQQYRMVIVGQHILNTNREVASCCTLLVEKYSTQDAQSMLKGGMVKKLLLAGLLLDTQNLDFSSVFCTARDEAVAALLLHGAGPNGRSGFYLQLKRQSYDPAFRNVLRETYGEIGNHSGGETSPEEAESHQHRDEEKTRKEVMAISEKPMVVKQEIGPVVVSGSSSNTDSSEPLTTINIDTSSFSRPNSTSSNSSDTAAVQVEVASTDPAGKSIQADSNPGAGGWKAMNRNSVSRFFAGFGRSPRNVVTA